MSRALKRVLLVPLALAAVCAMGPAPRECLELAAQRDREQPIAHGINVSVFATNGCSEDRAGRQTRFRVVVKSANGGTAGSQKGHFYGTIPAGGKAETKVFVECDPERTGEIEVEPLG